MKKYIVNSSVLLVSIGVLVACNSGETEDPVEEAPDQEVTGETMDGEEDDHSEADSNESDAMAEGNVEDQLDLKIGDTATIESTIGLYEITLHGVEVTQEVDGQLSELDEYMIAELTIRNIGEEPIDALDTIGNLELTDMPEGAGMTDSAEYFEEVNSFEGDINPNEEATAQALYYTYDADEYYVLVNEGLVGTGAVKNQITFTFEKSEAE
ncbi:DUF4352 domain-containing protein [Alkalicoccobacillus porphyridii]|nr:DUF4352 domain-containing protein [Alkalicoccobacillus porphyridii]